jgi:hypothetical protein
MISVKLKKIFCPTKLKFAKKYFGTRPINVLDIGCGNHSYSVTKKWLNIQHYTGVDKEYWGGDVSGYEGIQDLHFIDIDEVESLNVIQNNQYDYVILNHVIEHLKNGESLLNMLQKKMTSRGLIYIETPSKRTINYPSAKGFLNFYDDPTHKRIYEVNHLVIEMSRQGYKILKYGTRRDLKRILLFTLPALLNNLFFSIPFKKKLDARGLWDILGVASYILATKEK